jgi:para-nitrobenzyl esterase
MLKDDELWSKTEFFNEQIFRIPAITQAEKICKKGGKVYNYYWTFPSSIDKLKACHAVELSHVFNNVKNGIYSGGNYDLKLASKVQKMWTNFARNGNPSLDELVWNCYDLDKRETIILGENKYVEKDLLAEQRILMSPLAKYYINCIDVINEEE